MPQGFDEFKYLLVKICEITNFVLEIAIKSRMAQVIAGALIHRVIGIFHPAKTPYHGQRFSSYRKSQTVYSLDHQLSIKDNQPIQP